MKVKNKKGYKNRHNIGQRQVTKKIGNYNEKEFAVVYNEWQSPYRRHHSSTSASSAQNNILTVPKPDVKSKQSSSSSSKKCQKRKTFQEYSDCIIPKKPREAYLNADTIMHLMCKDKKLNVQSDNSAEKTTKERKENKQNAQLQLEKCPKNKHQSIKKDDKKMGESSIKKSSLLPNSKQLKKDSKPSKSLSDKRKVTKIKKNQALAKQDKKGKSEKKSCKSKDMCKQVTKKKSPKIKKSVLAINTKRRKNARNKRRIASLNAKAIMSATYNRWPAVVHTVTCARLKGMNEIKRKNERNKKMETGKIVWVNGMGCEGLDNIPVEESNSNPCRYCSRIEDLEVDITSINVTEDLKTTREACISQKHKGENGVKSPDVEIIDKPKTLEKTCSSDRGVSHKSRSSEVIRPDPVSPHICSSSLHQSGPTGNVCAYPYDHTSALRLPSVGAPRHHHLHDKPLVSGYNYSPYNTQQYASVKIPSSDIYASSWPHQNDRVQYNQSCSSSQPPCFIQNHEHMSPMYDLQRSWYHPINCSDSLPHPVDRSHNSCTRWLNCGGSCNFNSTENLSTTVPYKNPWEALYTPNPRPHYNSSNQLNCCINRYLAPTPLCNRAPAVKFDCDNRCFGDNYDQHGTHILPHKFLEQQNDDRQTQVSEEPVLNRKITPRKSSSLPDKSNKINKCVPQKLNKFSNSASLLPKTDHLATCSKPNSGAKSKSKPLTILPSFESFDQSIEKIVPIQSLKSTFIEGTVKKLNDNSSATRSNENIEKNSLCCSISMNKNISNGSGEEQQNHTCDKLKATDCSTVKDARTELKILLPKSIMSLTVTQLAADKPNQHNPSSEAEVAEKNKPPVAQKLNSTEFTSACKSISVKGWRLYGEPLLSKQADTFLDASKDKEELKQYYSSIVHDCGDIVTVRDCVLIKSGPRKKDVPFVAKVAGFWGTLKGDIMMNVLWYYRPEHVQTDKIPPVVDNEIFASKHSDNISVACIDDKCYVLTSSEYFRYQGQLKMLEEGRIPVDSIVRHTDEPYSRRLRLPPLDASPEIVFMCRFVYDIKLKRVLFRRSYEL